MDVILWSGVVLYCGAAYLIGFCSIREHNSKIKFDSESVQGRVVYSLVVWLFSPLLCFWFSVLFFYELGLQLLSVVFKVEEKSGET